MPDTPESNAFRRAAEIFGGFTPLSHWLKIPSDSLRKWASGEEVPPKAIYVEAAAMLSADKGSTADTPQASRVVVRRPGIGLGLRVLIADDDRDTLMTLGVLLRSEGFDARLLSRSTEVAAAVREFRPHAVLVDVDMPDRNGYEVAKELTQQYGSARPTLIAVTAHRSDLDRQAAKGCGFHHHVSKPYDPDRLLALLVALRR